MDDPWVILNSIEQSIKNKLEKYGTKLGDLPNIKINRGILTGCNEAFIIDEKKRVEILKNCKTKNEKERTVKLIRPILRGRDIKKNSVSWDHLYLICTHNGYTNELNEHVSRVNIENYPTLKKYFDKYIDLLEKREDKGETPYNLRSCAYMDDFYKRKICWPDISVNSSFARVENEMFVTNTAYIMVGGPEWLCDYLNSPIVNWYIKSISSGLGDNGSRFIKQFIVQVPIPQSYNPSLKGMFNLTEEEIDFLKSKDCM